MSPYVSHRHHHLLYPAPLPKTCKLELVYICTKNFSTKQIKKQPSDHHPSPTSGRAIHARARVAPLLFTIHSPSPARLISGKPHLQQAPAQALTVEYLSLLTAKSTRPPPGDVPHVHVIHHRSPPFTTTTDHRSPPSPTSLRKSLL